MDERHTPPTRHWRVRNLPPAPRGGAGVGGGSARPQAVDDLLDYKSACWRSGERPEVNACLDRRPGIVRRDDGAALDLICHEIPPSSARRGEVGAASGGVRTTLPGIRPPTPGSL